MTHDGELFSIEELEQGPHGKANAAGIDNILMLYTLDFSGTLSLYIERERVEGAWLGAQA